MPVSGIGNSDSLDVARRRESEEDTTILKIEAATTSKANPATQPDFVGGLPWVSPSAELSAAAFANPHLMGPAMIPAAELRSMASLNEAIAREKGFLGAVGRWASPAEREAHQRYLATLESIRDGHTSGTANERAQAREHGEKESLYAELARFGDTTGCRETDTLDSLKRRLQGLQAAAIAKRDAIDSARLNMGRDGKAGTSDDLDAYELGEWVIAMNPGTTTGSLLAAVSAAQGGSLDDVRTAGQAGAVIEGLAGGVGQSLSASGRASDAKPVLRQRGTPVRGAAQDTRFRGVDNSTTERDPDKVTYGPWRPNAGGVVRTPTEAIQIAQRHGVEVPEWVKIVEVENLSPNELAAYQLKMPRAMMVGTRLEWDRLLDADGNVVVRVQKGVFASDEAIVGVLSHEAHELNSLKAMVDEADGLPARDIRALIIPDGRKNLHDQAWDVADLRVRVMRAPPGSAERQALAQRLASCEARMREGNLERVTP